MDKFSIRPLHDKVIVECVEENTTKGGIVIPETAGEKPQQGFVIAVGPGKFVNGELKKTSVKPGDKILFGKYSGTDVKMDNRSFLVMSEDDIMGILN